tara:strand:+ start:289 stop:1623 length:1335 start_codon:yes stop_codon:yes gene_type:complete
MIITKMSLPRRTVLRGLGTALALPLLDAMVPAASALARTAAKPRRRFGVVYVPNGIAMEYWTPAEVGRGFPLTPILQPLAEFKDQMTVVSGLRGYWTPAHAGASTTFLTGAAGVAGETAPVADTSMDQLLAREYGQETELASLQLAIDSRANAGQCSGGHSCVYTNTICWRSRTTPLPMENNPRVVFEQMFGDSGSTDPAVRQVRMARDRSILDSVTDKVATLQRELGQDDSLKIDEYLEGVRDIERRIQRAEQRQSVDLPEVMQPEGIPSTFADHVRLMFDLQLLAHQVDLTRVTTFMLGREVSSRTYTEIGVPDAHHPLSHHEYKPEKIALMSKVNAYHASLFAEYLTKLRNTPDGDGSLLDNMLLMYGCGMSDSNAHSPLDLPVLLLGGCGGQIEGDRHLHYPDDPLMPNLLVTLMEKLDVPVDRVGESDGRLRLDGLAGV